MKQLIREAYTWEYTGEQPDRDEPVPLEEDDEEEIDFTSNMILSIFSNIEFLFVKKENGEFEKSYKHPDLRGHRKNFSSSCHVPTYADF